MEKDDINEKIDYIYSLEECSKLNEKDIQKLKILAADSEEEIRLAVSEVLALFTDETSEKILLSMLNDTSYLVQASTCDSLYFSSSLSTLTVLKGLSKHNRVLVRGYAALSIGDIQKGF